MYSYIFNYEHYTNITESDITIYGSNKDTSEDSRQAGYNIGDLLHMPYLAGLWGMEIPNSSSRISIISKLFVPSILHEYMNLRTKEEAIPNIPRIIEAVQSYENKVLHTLPLSFTSVFEKVKRPDCLCVHLRLGDQNASSSFLSIVKKLSTQFSSVIFLSGVHRDTIYKNNSLKIQNTISVVNQLGNNIPHSDIYLDEPDQHILLMKHATHLLIHKGGFSCLGSIVNTGQLYITNEFTHAFHPHWITHVSKKYILL